MCAEHRPRIRQRARVCPHHLHAGERHKQKQSVFASVARIIIIRSLEGTVRKMPSTSLASHWTPYGQLRNPIELLLTCNCSPYAATAFTSSLFSAGSLVRDAGSESPDIHFG